jgi:hypothetical protein
VRSPWRLLGAVAGCAALVLVVVLTLAARFAARDPGVRLQRVLADVVPGSDVTVHAAPVAEGAGDAARVFVRVPTALTAAASDVVLRTVWLRYDARLGSVAVVAPGTAATAVTAGELRSRFGPRPAALAATTYSRVADRARLVAILVVVAVVMMFGLVLCASVAAVLTARARQRRRR